VPSPAAAGQDDSLMFRNTAEGPAGGLQASGFAGPSQAADPIRLAAANINPLTGLSTDYLNHFNEAVMVLEMLPSMPECAEDLAGWRPLTYREHFSQSHLHAADLVIAAYEHAAPQARAPFDALCEAMKVMIVAAQGRIGTDAGAPEIAAFAGETAAALKPLIARASAIIHGSEASAGLPASIQAYQAAVDAVIAP
jgi:hypothetical protein